MMYLNMFLIVIATICIVDLSGFIDTLKSGIKFVLTKGKFSNPDYSLKPIDCSLCMSWWLQLLYLLIIGNCTIINIGIALLLSCSTQQIKGIIQLIQDLITTLINYIYKKID